MLTKQELFERVDALLPAIAARAGAAETLRKPHPDSIQDLIDAEVIQALVPKMFGGHELELDTLAGVASRISSACMSTGWVSAFYLGHNWMLSKFSEQIQREVWRERPFGLIPIQPSPNLSIKPVSGGYCVSGRSSFSSGIMNADWVIITKAGGDHARACVVPVSEVKIDDVWHMSGMAATGSNDVIVEDLFVPTYRTLATEDLFNTTDSMHSNPMYHLPLLAFIYCEVMGVYTGGLLGTTEAYEAHVNKKKMTWGGDALAGKQAVHIHLGEAKARASAMLALLDDLVSHTMHLAQSGKISLKDRLELKARASYICDQCREGVNNIASYSGTHNFALSSPIQRFFRDINTIATHAFIDREVGYEQLGRHLLGLAPNSPLI